MENWKEITKDLGRLKAEESIVFTFDYIGNPKQIRRIKKDCGCAKLIFRDNKLVVTYKPYSLDKKTLESFTEYKAEKTLQVLWKDSTVDTLTFKATIYHETDNLEST